MATIGQKIKQEIFETSYQKAFINLLYTANFLRDTHNVLFKEFDLQGQHFNVLRILKGKHPETVQPGYIKEVMLDKGCDLTRLLDKLQKRGYITRYFDQNNKRNVNVNLTQEGLILIKNMSEELRKIDNEFKQNLTDSEFEQLSELLDKCRG